MFKILSGIVLLVLAILSVVLPFFCDDEERKGIFIAINENGDLMF